MGNLGDGKEGTSGSASGRHATANRLGEGAHVDSSLPAPSAPVRRALGRSTSGGLSSIPPVRSSTFTERWNQRERFLAERARLRAELQRELKKLGDEASHAQLEPVELRRRLDDILNRYLGDAARDPNLRQSIDDVLRRYERLTDATEQKEALEDLARLFGLDSNGGPGE